MKTKIQKIYREVYKSLAKDESLNSFKKRMVETINRAYPNATQREKYMMYKTAHMLRQSGDTRANLERVIKTENLIKRHEEARAHKSFLTGLIKDSRERTDPIVFYLSSHHANPAEDHEYWEGMVYVDYFWRRTVQGIYPPEKIRQIEKYIDENHIYTLQWVVGFPVYLTTRPYCRHYFTPVPTSEVLGSDLSTIKKNHPETKMWYRKLSDKERGKRFQDKRNLISRALSSLPINENVKEWLGSKPYTKRV